MSSTDDAHRDFSAEERAEIAARADYLARSIFQRVLDEGFNSREELQQSIAFFLDKIPQLVEGLEQRGPVTPPFGGETEPEGPDRQAFNEGSELIAFIRERVETEIIRFRLESRNAPGGDA